MVTITYEEFENVIVTALEGGSNYWYITDTRDFPTEPKGEPASIRIAWNLWNTKDWSIPVYDLENRDEKLGDLTLEGFKTNAHIADFALQDLKRDNLDAWSADSLFQVAIMGEVVFG